MEEPVRLCCEAAHGAAGWDRRAALGGTGYVPPPPPSLGALRGA